MKFNGRKFRQTLTTHTLAQRGEVESERQAEYFLLFCFSLVLKMLAFLKNNVHKIKKRHHYRIA